jgi:hypothetical protein
MSLFKFKKDIDWNSELVNCAWFAVLLTYTAIMFVLQAIGACTHPNTPFIFGWPGMVWLEHPVLLSFFNVLYIVLTFAIFFYGAVLTESRGENREKNQKLGYFYVNVSCVMVLGPVFNWTLLIIVWVITMLFKGILATLYFFFYKLPIYFVSADERKQKKAEEAQQRKEENEHIVKKLIKDFDSIRK